ncbi:hypothetical protein LIS04_94 [Listeria phage LIS04]|nr:hypothetical protein LIS04_94 [Listeria phage LIS04]
MNKSSRRLQFGEVVSLPVDVAINSKLTLTKNSPFLVTNSGTENMSTSWDLEPMDGDSITKLSEPTPKLKLVAVLNESTNYLEYQLNPVS